MIVARARARAHVKQSGLAIPPGHSATFIARPFSSAVTGSINFRHWHASLSLFLGVDVARGASRGIAVCLTGDSPFESDDHSRGLKALARSFERRRDTQVRPIITRVSYLLRILLVTYLVPPGPPPSQIENRTCERTLV